VHNVVSSCRPISGGCGEQNSGLAGDMEVLASNSICVACQVQNVFFYRGCKFAFAGVDVGDDGAPDFGLGQGQVDGVAFSHVPGKY
jgi:hypothetical protein